MFATTNFSPLASVIASLESGAATYSPNTTLRETPLNEGVVRFMSEAGSDTPFGGECKALVKSIAKRFATRTGEGKTLIHWDLVDDMIQGVSLKFLETKQHPNKGWDSFGKYLAVFACGVCKNINRAEAKQNPNRMLSRFVGRTPGIGEEAWAAYLMANPAPLFKGDAGTLPLDLVKQSRKASVRDNHSRIDHLIDTGRNPNAPMGVDLTPTEQQVLDLTGRGYSLTEVAESFTPTFTPQYVGQILKRLESQLTSPK